MSKAKHQEASRPRTRGGHGEEYLPTGNARGRTILTLMVLALGLAWGVMVAAPVAMAQAPIPAAPQFRAPGQQRAAFGGFSPEYDFRLFFVLLDQYSFNEHPLYQVTRELDSKGYANAKSAGSNIFTAGYRITDYESGTTEKILHALPPFGMEWIYQTPIPFPQGVGVGFDYFMFPMYDAALARGVSTVLPIKMDAYIYNAVLRFYFFNPREPGLNYFMGVGIGTLEGKLLADPWDVFPAEIYSFAQRPANSLRMGLETLGENFGFRYELAVVNAKRVELTGNSYCPTYPSCTGATQLDFSGTIVRLVLQYRFQ